MGQAPRRAPMCDGEIRGDGVDERRVVSLDHDARERLRARVAQEDPAGPRHLRLGGAPDGREAGNLVEGDAVPDLHVPEDLRRVDEPGLRRELLAGRRDEGREVEAGERSVARRREVGADQVAGLLPAEERGGLLHLLDDVPVADGRAQERHAAFLEGLLEPPVRHDGPDDGLGALAFALHLVRPQVEDVVPVEEGPGVVGDDDAVGVAVERDAEVGAGDAHGIAHLSGVERAAGLVDVLSVRIDVSRDHGRAGGPESGGRRLERGAVRGVDHDLQAVEPVGKRRDEVVHVRAAEVRLDDGGRERRGPRLVDVALDLELDLVGELAALAREDLHAVVRPRVVRGGDDDAGVGAELLREERDGRGRDDAREAHEAAGLREAAGQGPDDGARGLARVAAHDDGRGSRARATPRARRRRARPSRRPAEARPPSRGCRRFRTACAFGPDVT